MWASDYAENSGEGKLARMFIKYLLDQYNYKIKFHTNQKRNKELNVDM